MMWTLMAGVIGMWAGVSDDPRLDWWREARFGLFIHWGLYAIPAGEWNGKPVDGTGEWIMHNAKIPVPEYEPLATRFNPTRFDARRWVELAKAAGMKYIVITSKHHDGFCLFDSKHTDYDIMDAAPFKRDVLKELAAECARQQIRLCFYHSILDWHHPDARGERFPKYVEYMHNQLRELLKNYGPIGVLWFDGEWADEWNNEFGRQTYDLCRSLQPDIIVNNRVGKGRQGMSDARVTAGDFGTPEQEVPATGLPGQDWETCMTMNDTWGFKKADDHWKSAGEMIRMLVDIASKGGNFLLNVGPTAAGEIPQPSIERLEAMGAWLRRNGESIYGTKASVFGQLSFNGRCTVKGDRLFLHVFEWPAERTIGVQGLQNKVRSVKLLADSRELRFEQVGSSVTIHLPDAPIDPVDTVIVVVLDGAPELISTTTGKAGP